MIDDPRSSTVLSPFLPADGRGSVRRQTLVRLSRDDIALHVRFECRDHHRWATFERRDDPLWQEEVVEVFIAPGADTPTRYFEIELNPLGALFDAEVHNPEGLRGSMSVRTEWDCPGIEWRVGTSQVDQDWWAELSLPWRPLLGDDFADGGDDRLPAVWRANFLRVERPGGPGDTSADEYSCWSPTWRRPADFHVPERFGFLVLDQRDIKTVDLPVAHIPQLPPRTHRS